MFYSAACGRLFMKQGCTFCNVFSSIMLFPAVVFTIVYILLLIAASRPKVFQHPACVAVSWLVLPVCSETKWLAFSLPEEILARCLH